MTTIWSHIDAIYLICNPHHEKDRYESALRRMSSHGFPVEKIKIAGPTWGTSLSSTLCFQVYDPYLPRAIPSLIFKNRALTRAEISLILNFYSAIKDAHEAGYKSIMIFESDIIFHHQFTTRLESVFEQLAGKTWDYISLSDGVGTHLGDYTQNARLYGQWLSAPQTVIPAPQFFTFRCTDSMIISRRFIEHLYHHLIPFRDCLDWELNFQLYSMKGAGFWTEPHIVEQGSCKGINPSQL
jgi:hypothetical protein